MGRRADAGQTDTQAHTTVCVAGVILRCVVDDETTSLTRQHIQ